MDDGRYKNDSILLAIPENFRIERNGIQIESGEDFPSFSYVSLVL